MQVVNRRILTSLMGAFAVQVFGVVTGVFLARGLGPHGRGVFAAMVLWPTFCVSLGDLGLSNSFAYYAARQRGSTGALWRTALRATGLQTLYLAPITIAIAWAGLRHIDASSIGSGLLLAAAFVPAALASRYAAALCQGLESFGSLYAIRLSMQVGIALALAGAYVGGALTLRAAVASYIAGLVLMSVITVVVARARFGSADRDDEPKPNDRELLSYGLRSLVGSVYPFEALFLDQIIVALFLPAKDLGLYVAALAFTSLPRLVAYAVGVTSMPAVARLAIPRQAAAVRRQIGIGLALLVPITAVIIVSVPELVPRLFGDPFRGAILASQVITFSSLLFGVRRILGDSLRGAGMPGVVSASEAASWLLLIVGTMVGSHWGLDGVAWALAAVQVAALCMLLLVWRKALKTAHVLSEEAWA